MNKKIKVAWGIDIENKVPEIMENTMSFIKKLNELGDFQIDPVHVTSANNLIYTDFALPDVESMLPGIKKKVKEYLEPFADLGLTESVVLENYSSYRSSEVDTFLEYVEKREYDLVLLSAHGNSGLRRLVLGSFTESCLLSSERPTFVINAESHHIDNIRQALFPVEINKNLSESLKGLLAKRALDFVSTFKIYHHVSAEDYVPVNWVPQNYQPSFYKHAEEAEAMAEEYFSKILETECPSERLKSLVTRGERSLVGEINSVLEESESSLLVLNADTTRFKYFFLSSLTKEMIKKSASPVLVVPQKTK